MEKLGNQGARRGVLALLEAPICKKIWKKAYGFLSWFSVHLLFSKQTPGLKGACR